MSELEIETSGFPESLLSDQLKERIKLAKDNIEMYFPVNHIHWNGHSSLEYYIGANDVSTNVVEIINSLLNDSDSKITNIGYSEYKIGKYGEGLYLIVEFNK